MAAPFAYPGNNVSGFIEFIQYTDHLTGGLLGVAMLIMIGFVAFFTTKSFPTDRALGFTSFLVMISALFLRFLSLISDAVFFVTIVLFVLAVVFLIKERNTEEAGV